MKKIDLNGVWKISQPEKRITAYASVPGGVYESLLENKIIEDPFYGKNEAEVQWVHECDWIYERNFTINEKDLESGDISLIFHGLDTFTEICLNSNLLGESSDMHLAYEFTCKNDKICLLKPGENTVSVRFKSPTAEVKNRLKSIGFEQVDESLKQPYAIFGVESIRKSYYSFGWDWGPKLPEMGIWRKVELVIGDTVAIKNLKIDTEIVFKSGNTDRKPEASSAGLRFEFDAATNGIGLGYTTYELFVKKDSKVICEKNGKLESENVVEIVMENPCLWWTHDFGKPEMYEVEINVCSSGKRVYIHSEKFGVRKIELVRDTDKWGETFYFRLNGVPVFAKGANWIPSDSFIPRGRKNKLTEKVLKDAIKANMNMIRVWGGGIYEDDEFYDFCDENGLLVWQDFAFACKPTPDFDFLIENIKKEAEYNVKRLRNHPSLAVWIGNNEMEEGWVYWGFEEYVPQFKATYTDIFENILPDIISKFDGKRPYWPSSPSSGGDFENPRSPDKGDSHYWMVWHAMYPFKSYREFDSRFMSEFGFESFPSIKTLKMFCPDEQLYMDSDIMESHQKNPAGNGKILDYMKQRFSIPESFEKQVIISQITQAEAMEYGVEHWRRNRNEYHCMGSLYWQLNDCWPVASWSSIDYYGRWKALHYYAARFYSPIFVSGEEDENGIGIWVTNDTPKDENLTMNCSLYSISGELLKNAYIEITAKHLSSQKFEYLSLGEISPDEAVAFFELLDDHGNCVSKGSKLFTAPKNLKLENPGLKFDIEHLENGVYVINIYSGGISLYVHVDSDFLDLTVEDNFFNMKPMEKVRMAFKTDFNGGEEELKNLIHVNSLWELLN